MKTPNFFLVALLLVVITSCSKDDEPVVKSKLKELTSFVIKDIEATVDEQLKTVAITLPVGTTVTALKATAEISEKASISPDPTAALDYSKPVVFEVKAEDGTTQEYTVTVTLEAATTVAPFVTTWKTTSPDKKILISTNRDYIYNYTIDWGDGVVQDGQTSDAVHTYKNAGEYTVKISGDFPTINFRGNVGFNDNIISIDSWGDIKWQSMERAFINCSDLIYKATDVPGLSRVESLKSMFYGVSYFNGDIGDWDVSNVTDMGGMFYRAISFNQDIGGWNVSNVTNMGQMFEGVRYFNGDIGNWNVSNVTNMMSMFKGVSAFGKDIGVWNVSNVKNMANMFRGASNFNRDIGGWDVSNVTDMGGMFYLAISFNQDIGGWNVSNVVNMKNMFFNAKSFNQDIGDWNVSNVTNMWGMFYRAGTFNQDIGDWDVSSVIDMENMFRRASAFNQDIGDWNVSNVKNMRDMFENAKVMYINYEALLIGWEKNGVSKDVEFNGGFSKYRSQAAVQARGRLINNNNWLITDGGKE
ncbi:BspA family leucine-rich repeat surface protein [Aquimarina algiphila]|uniref:BspA family leucine-rich repeat surface protein n=2 Tax=Aquimarina algiphila TaxID=2047982 RepID=A0A554VP17_9FLAO|nr:BspA family leucine-rich repeat surface protein [Aquimarina algiphila]TSE10131.1 BspA family leucine-rich repeat surface protein [Aquimarina algiphila]